MGATAWLIVLGTYLEDGFFSRPGLLLITAAIVVSALFTMWLKAAEVLPLLTPVVIFGAGAVLAKLDRVENGAIWLLAAFSAVAVLLSPFVAAAALRLNLLE